MKRMAVLVVLLLSVVSLANGVCAPLFSAASINGVQYPVQSTLNYPPPVVSGVISLNLQFRTVFEMVTAISGISLQYAVDNQPVGPVLTDNFSWGLDTTKIADGTHS